MKNRIKKFIFVLLTALLFSGAVATYDATTTQVYAAESYYVLPTTMECSVWSQPATQEPYRVKKIPAGYPVTVDLSAVVNSTISDGKTFYRTVTGNYILCKCFDTTGVVINPDKKRVGKNDMVVWSYSTNGTPIYYYDSGVTPEWFWNNPTGWPQYLIDAINESGVTPVMSDYDKAVTLARYISKRLKYGDLGDMYTAATTKGALTNNVAICQGYTNAYNQLLQMMGIECYYVTGYANNGRTTGRHGWTKLIIDGVTYYTDTTWLKAGERYLMTTLESMSRDHDGDVYGITKMDTVW